MSKEKKDNKKLLIILGLLAIIIATVFITLKLMAGDKINKDAVDKDAPEGVRVEIPAGSSVNKIAEILEEKQLIHNQASFLQEVENSGKDNELKAGEFALSKSMDLDEILDAIVSGKSNISAEKLTIPEGFELPQIAERLDEETDLSGEVFLDLTSKKENYEDEFEFLRELDDNQSLEGFLFPATYDIYPDMTEDELITRMLQTFENVFFGEILAGKSVDDLDMSFNEIISLASIIEREAKVDSERPTMSAVFRNRLEQGMPLQSCATVQYILGERKVNLSTADTQIDSPFNTYINEGLPPSPIASSGRVSLRAAVEPEEDVDYLFFVLTGDDGSHTFSKTYEEHLKAKNN